MSHHDSSSFTPFPPPDKLAILGTVWKAARFVSSLVACAFLVVVGYQLAESRYRELDQSLANTQSILEWSISGKDQQLFLRYRGESDDQFAHRIKDVLDEGMELSECDGGDDNRAATWKIFKLPSKPDAEQAP